MVMKLRVGGLLWMGIECKTFVWANSSRCRHTPQNPSGDVTYPKIVKGNLMADAGAFFMHLCVRRGSPSTIGCVRGNTARSNYRVHRSSPLSPMLLGKVVSFGQRHFQLWCKAGGCHRESGGEQAVRIPAAGI